MDRYVADTSAKTENTVAHLGVNAGLSSAECCRSSDGDVNACMSVSKDECGITALSNAHCPTMNTALQVCSHGTSTAPVLPEAAPSFP